MKLDLSSLLKAIGSLERTLAVAAAMKAERPDDLALAEGLRAGVVQNFEFSYELSWKFMKRWLEENIGAAYVDGVPRRELFRYAAESLLIESVSDWMLYHTLRNRTSHTYEPAIAQEVADAAPDLLAAAQKLYKALAERNA